MTEPPKPDPAGHETRPSRARTRKAAPRAKGTRRKKDAATGLFVSKLTTDVTEKIAVAIEKGATPETAAAAAGVHVSTFRRWLAEGRSWIDMHDEDELPSPEAQFSARIDRALATLRETMELSLAGADDWRAKMEYLARRWPRDWGKRDRLDVGNPEGETFSIAGIANPEAIYTREEMALLRGLLAKGAAAQQGADVIDMPARRRELGAG